MQAKEEAITTLLIKEYEDDDGESVVPGAVAITEPVSEWRHQ